MCNIARVDNAFLVSLVGLRPEKHFWLGLSNQENIDEFVWTKANSVTFTHWNTAMPGMEKETSHLKIEQANKDQQFHFSSRLPAGLRGHDNWHFGWALGFAALLQHREIHLQTSGRGGGIDCSTTNSSSAYVSRRLDSSGDEKLLRQGTRTDLSDLTERNMTTNTYEVILKGFKVKLKSW